jgi:SAM-dependent methyltransferase
MIGEGLRNWFGRGAPEAPARAEPLVIVPERPAIVTAVVPAGPKAAWPPERVAVNDALWGEGYTFPGGEIETLRMAKPLGLSAASSMLVLGIGGGGPACSLATKFGAWITGYEADPDLGVIATERAFKADLAKRVRVEHWDPEEPDFQNKTYHHTMALEPMRGARPEPLLAAMAAALKPSGQLVMLELVADTPLDPRDPVVADWARLERRPAKGIPSEIAVTRILGRLGFDVRIAEDLSERHMQQAMLGWRRTVRRLEAVRPLAREASQVVAEAELWLLRLRLFRERKLRLIRWHAIKR